jgi:hypothetical protein
MSVLETFGKFEVDVLMVHGNEEKTGQRKEEGEGATLTATPKISPPPDRKVRKEPLELVPVG